MIICFFMHKVSIIFDFGVNMSYYNYNEFKEACGVTGNVVVFSNAEKGAEMYFNLYPKSVLLSFIYNNGLDDLSFLNTKKWEKNPDKENVIMVDAYEFRSLNKLGYIAFMKSCVTKKWIIKSFKISENSNNAMALALQKSGLLGLEE